MCLCLGSGTNQLVTITNHLDGVDLMVLSGVGGSCVTLWWCGIQAFLCQVYCAKNWTNGAYGFFGKIHAVIRQDSELVWIIFHDKPYSGDYFPQCFVTNICQ